MWKYYSLRLAYLLLGRLPVRVLYGIARVTGDASYLARPGARRAVTANMRQVMGAEAAGREVRRATRDVFRNATRYYADLFHNPHMDVQRFAREGLDLEGVEYLKDARDSGRGGVVVGAHYGNPEMAVQGVAAYGISVMGLTEPLEPQALSDFTDRLRSQHGHTYRTATVSGLKEVLRHIRSGGLLAILIDRDIGGTGTPMQFCGAEARVPLGGIDLALRTGADLIPAMSWRIPGYRFRVRIGPPLELIRTGGREADLRANAERVLALLSEQIRSDPGQWAVLEQIWDANPAPSTRPGTLH